MLVPADFRFCIAEIFCQKFSADNKWWAFTRKKFGDSQKFLWLRNNGSTLLSQLINTVLFTWGTFLGVYDTTTMVSITASSYIIFLVTSIADTPFIYLAG